VTNSLSGRDLLDRAGAARAAGRGDVASRLYDEAVAACRAADDQAGWTEAALGAASVYVFGSEPGKLPAQLYDVLARTTDDATRARLEAALARCWAYAGRADRALRFSDEAMADAERVGAAELVADCLDAALAAHWGPDELAVRRTLAARLDDVAAHVLDPDARLRAHLWGLQVACEALDLLSMHRHMRALELLGEESARARFFAASRRHMLDVLRGRFDTTPALIAVATAAAEEAALADAWMVIKSMAAYTAAMTDDSAGCEAAGAEMEAFALAEGATTVSAQAAFMWVCAGRLDRAGSLVHSFHPPVLDDLPRDVNWMLTLQCALEAAMAVGDRGVVENAFGLLDPYEGRAVFDAGAVVFHGLTDDTLARAASLLGDPERAARLRSQALAVYERIGAQWWRDRLAAWGRPATVAVAGRQQRVHLHPIPGGLWLIGPEGATTPVAGLRGFGYLRQLVRRPGRPLAALDLAGAGTAVAESGLGDVIDRRALDAYRRRLGDLDRELAEAEQWSDIGRLEMLEAERDALLKEIAGATGLGGRPRTTGSSQERARVAVTKAITTAINRVAAIDESVGLHLHAAISTGAQCAYDPPSGDEREWILD
jgi:tetratricopeptide (TPR) repeat protein